MDEIFNATVLCVVPMAIFKPAPLARYLEIVTLIPLPSLLIFFAYLLMVNLLLRWWKRNTSPLELRLVMPIYNLLLVAANTYCFFEFVRSFARADHIYSKERDELMVAAYDLYYLTKVIELLDTVFMLLRHKFRQISFLHVFHHSTMVLLADLGRREYPWPAFAFPLSLNSCVHIFLYLYYAASAAAIEVPLSLKKSLTLMQITQFILDLVFAAYGLLYHGFCVWSILYGLMMLQQFAAFYKHRYISSAKDRNKKRE